MQATVGMYGDLQGIAGRSLQEIDGLSLAAPEGPARNLRGASSQPPQRARARAGDAPL
jgi:hypothetical protein